MDLKSQLRFEVSDDLLDAIRSFPTAPQSSTAAPGSKFPPSTSMRPVLIAAPASNCTASPASVNWKMCLTPSSNG